MRVVRGVSFDRAILVTRVYDVDAKICDHGCSQMVIMTNILDGSTWKMCSLSYERSIAQGLTEIDESSRHIERDSPPRAKWV